MNKHHGEHSTQREEPPTTGSHTLTPHVRSRVFITRSTDTVIFLLRQREDTRQKSIRVFLNSVPKGSQDELASTRKDVCSQKGHPNTGQYSF